MPDGGRFHVLISSESTKLNVNFLLQNGRDDLLSTLFTSWGIAQAKADAAVQGLRKYLSNSVNTVAVSTQNASANTAGNTAGNTAVQLGKQFGSVAEMSLVPEFGPVMEKRPDWMNYFTIWGDGKIDVNLADADTIALITGVSAATAEQVVKYRWGLDGIPFTLDDRVYNSMDEVRAALGMGPEQFLLVQDYLSLTSAVDRIESTGSIAGYEKQIAVVTMRNSIPITYLSWQEK
jgi:DNA uptake protein ComE-like DNA-binding protein